MTEFKFACPVCGQHITCDSAKSGTKLDCPTCFQKLIVPHAPADASGKLILTAVQAQTRPVPQEIASAAKFVLPAARRKFPVVIIALLACFLGGLFAYFGNVLERTSQSDAPHSSDTAMVGDSGWKADLDGVAIPNAPAKGRLGGRTFNASFAVLEGGMLILRQGEKGDWQLSLVISLFADRGEELADQEVYVDARRERGPKVVLSWKGEPQSIPGKKAIGSYLLRVQFGEVTEDGHLPGKIYFCAFDSAKSWVAGTFDAELRMPPPRHRPRGPFRPRRQI